MAATLVASYPIVTSKNTVSNLDTASVACLAGDSIVVLCGHQLSVLITDVTWGSLAMGSGFSLGAYADDSTGAGSSAVEIYAAHNVPAGTHTVSVIHDGIVLGGCEVQVWRGFAASANDQASPNTATGTSTTPSTGATGTLAQADEAQVAIVMTNGPVADTAGTWGNSLTASQRDGTTGSTAGSNRTVSTAYRVLAATTAVTASKSGITSRTWVATELTMKAQAVTAVAVGRADETDAALALAPVKLIATGRADEADSAIALGVTKLVPIARADETDGALALGTVKRIPVGMAVEVGEVPEGEILPYTLLYYPSALAGADGLETIDPWNGSPIDPPQASYRMSDRGVRVCGSPYMAAMSAPSPYFSTGFNEDTLYLSFCLHALPVQLSDPDEVHQIFSYQSLAPNLFELVTIGITPSGRLVTEHPIGGALMSPVGVVKPGPNAQLATVQFFNLSRILGLDGVALVTDNYEQAWTMVTPTSTRIMLFNGLAGRTRCECSIYGAGVSPEGLTAMRWPVSEGSGADLYAQTPVVVDQLTGETVWTKRDANNLDNDFGTGDWKLTLDWYDPGAYGLPRLYSALPANAPQSCYSWSRKGVYTPRNPAATTFTPITRP